MVCQNSKRRLKLWISFQLKPRSNKRLKVKQDMADKAMDKITDTLESASDRRKEVEILRKDMELNKNTESKKADIE